MSAPLTPSLEEFRTLAAKGNLVAVSTELVADAETPVSAFQKIDEGGYSFLLESVEKSDQAGRYSFVGSGPNLIFESRGRRIRITEGRVTREFETTTDPLYELEALMKRYQPVPSPGAGESRLRGRRRGLSQLRHGAFLRTKHRRTAAR
jgi:anthranilate synthase component 1